MEDVIFSQQRTLDKILLEGQYEYYAYITIGLVQSGHFRIFLEFNNLDADTLNELTQLYFPLQAIRIKSKLLTREKYNISHIIVEKIYSKEVLSLTWECISDEPEFSLL